MMGRTARLLVLIGLTTVCGGPAQDGDGGDGGGVAREWDADSICDEPGLEWACEELPPKEAE